MNPTPMPFVIVKQRKHARKVGTRSDIKLSPRSAQRVLDWELQTRQLEVGKAWNRRQKLWAEYHRLNKELDLLDEIETIRTIVLGWREEVKNAKQMRNTQSRG